MNRYYRTDINFLRFARKITKTDFWLLSVCPFVHPSAWITRHPLYGFSWNLIFGYFSKIIRITFFSDKIHILWITKNNTVLSVKKGTQHKGVQYLLQNWTEKHKGRKVYCSRTWLEHFFVSAVSHFHDYVIVSHN